MAMPEDIKYELFAKDRELVKEAFKEAASEWMDKQYAKVGRWTLAAFGVLILGAAIYLIGHFGSSK